jgi:hypothetical protein
MSHMDELEESLVWSKSGTEESRLFYASSIKSLAKKYPSRSEEDLAGEVVALVIKKISAAVEIYGIDGEEENIVIRCQLPKETGGIWAFDVRFTLSGRSAQVLTAARTVKEISEILDREINGTVRDTRD